MSNLKFQNALKRVPQKCPPIWMMRQAGRYHAHYQALKAKHSFMELCKVPELAAEVAMGPIQDFDFDVAILFSDLLFPLEALGMGLQYSPGPVLGWHLESPSSLSKLRSIDEAVLALEFQKQAVKHTRERLPDTKSLIGFVGGPWTLFAYATQGAHEGGLLKAKKNLSLWPQFSEVLTQLLIKNIALQIEGGAEVVMVFDTSAGELDPITFKSLVLPKLLELCRTYPGKLGYYSKLTSDDHFNQEFWNAPWAGLGFDHRWSLKRLLTSKQPGFVQGNFDQALLHLSSDELKVALKEYLEPLRSLDLNERRGWVCGLGHGVLQHTPEVNVKAFVNIVRESFA
ncbi:MAG: uroporphyrinogen decarboxylase [Oligoflexia bacterium]|nr:uroporphyrinogen decarboxylase [Oligoflexia bacterium]